MQKQQPTVGPDNEDKRLIVIDVGGGVVHGVETNILELLGVKVLVLGDKKDSQVDRDEVGIEGTDPDSRVIRRSVLRSATAPGS